MPTIEEKLSVLDKLILDDATKSRDAILDQLRQDSDQKLADLKADIDRRAEEEYRRESSKATQERESRVSRARIDARKSLMATRNEIITSVLDDLKKRLEAFARTDSYQRYLTDSLQGALARIGEAVAAPANGNTEVPGVVNVYLTPRDYDAYAKGFMARYRDVNFRRGTDDMVGGCRVENAAAGVYIDDTFEKKIELSLDELYIVSALEIGLR